MHLVDDFALLGEIHSNIHLHHVQQTTNELLQLRHQLCPLLLR